MEVTHPRWRVRGQRQRSPAAASTILHLHNNHTLEENRRCGNYNEHQPTRGTQPHIILHLHNNHTQEKTWRCGLSYQQPTTGTTNNQPQLTTSQHLDHRHRLKFWDQSHPLNTLVRYFKHGHEGHTDQPSNLSPEQV